MRFVNIPRQMIIVIVDNYGALGIVVLNPLQKVARTGASKSSQKVAMWGSARLRDVGVPEYRLDRVVCKREIPPSSFWIVYAF
jgi:hypothetical protein